MSTLNLPPLPVNYRWRIRTERYDSTTIFGSASNTVGMRVAIQRRDRAERRTVLNVLLDWFLDRDVTPVWGTVESSRSADDTTENVQAAIDRVYHRFQLTRTVEETHDDGDPLLLPLVQAALEEAWDRGALAALDHTISKFRHDDDQTARASLLEQNPHRARTEQ